MKAKGNRCWVNTRKKERNKIDRYEAEKEREESTSESMQFILVGFHACM